MASKGRECCGVVHTRVKCARGKHGGPIKMNSPCSRCKEWRCKAHCRCQREKNAGAEGRHAPRDRQPPQAKAKVQPKAQVKAKAAAAPRLAAAPQARPVASTTEILPHAAWKDKLAQEVKVAEKVQMAVMIFDDPVLFQALKTRLMTHSGFSCSLVVDRKHYLEGTSNYQAGRLRELQSLGAVVKVAAGHRSGREWCRILGAGFWRLRWSPRRH